MYKQQRRVFVRFAGILAQYLYIDLSGIHSRRAGTSSWPPALPGGDHWCLDAVETRDIWFDIQNRRAVFSIDEGHENLALFIVNAEHL